MTREGLAKENLGPAPEGFEYLWEPDTEWRLVEGDDRKCRGARHCPGEVVAELKRRAFIWRRREYVDRWYAYCEDHLYGRYIDDGHVMIWRCREVTS